MNYQQTLDKLTTILSDQYSEAELILKAETDKDVIVFCGVEFMAETAKILSPEKTVLVPSNKAGCSLASSITADDVRKLKAQFPGVPVVTYINTYADVKAETPNREMLRLCAVRCPYMNQIQLKDTYNALKYNQYEITIPEEIRLRAYKSVERMLQIGLALVLRHSCAGRNHGKKLLDFKPQSRGIPVITVRIFIFE